MDNQREQLCWSCEKACHKNICVWVRTLTKRPQGAIVNKLGYIVECPKYKKDKYWNPSTTKSLAKKYGITHKTFENYKSKLAEIFGCKITDEDVDTFLASYRQPIKYRSKDMKKTFYIKVAIDVPENIKFKVNNDFEIAEGLKQALENNIEQECKTSIVVAMDKKFI